MNTDQNNQTDQSNNWHYNWHHRPWRMGKFWVIVVILIVLAIIFGHHDHYYDGEAGNSNAHTISVSGHGEVFASPDVAEFSFSASDKETTVTDAQDKMTAKANAAIDFLKKNGVDAKDIKTTDYNVNPTYEYKTSVVCSPYSPCPPGNQTLTGYEVTETISVKLRDTSKSGAILQGVGQAGVSNVSGLSFTIDNPDSLKQQARKMAIDKAEADAKQLAKDLHVRLGKVLSFSEEGNNPQPIPYLQKATLSSADSAAVAPAPNIQTGQNKISSDVTITYEIK